MATVLPYCATRQKQIDAELKKYSAATVSADFSQPDTIPVVQAVNYKNEKICKLTWLNNYRTRELFPEIQRPYQRQLLPPLQLPSDHELWQEISTYLIDIFHHYMENKAKHQNLPLKNLIFRRKDDFYSGHGMHSNSTGYLLSMNTTHWP